MQIKTTAEAIAWLKTVRHFNCGSVITLLEDAEKREAALREELEAESKGADRAAECLMEWRRDCIDLQQRLTVAERLLQRVIDSSVLSFEQDAPEELESLEADICAALKPAAKPHKCIECDSQYCHGVCVERGDDDERYKGAEGEGS